MKIAKDHYKVQRTVDGQFAIVSTIRGKMKKHATKKTEIEAVEFADWCNKAIANFAKA